MFANNHHNDGHVAMWIPAAPGIQAGLIHNFAQTILPAAYVGVRGWVGIEWKRLAIEDLAGHIHDAWRLIAPKKLKNFDEFN